MPTTIDSAQLRAQAAWRACIKHPLCGAARSPALSAVVGCAGLGVLGVGAVGAAGARAPAVGEALVGAALREGHGRAVNSSVEGPDVGGRGELGCGVQGLQQTVTAILLSTDSGY